MDFLRRVVMVSGSDLLKRVCSDSATKVIHDSVRNLFLGYVLDLETIQLISSLFSLFSGIG